MKNRTKRQEHQARFRQQVMTFYDKLFSKEDENNMINNVQAVA